MEGRYTTIGHLRQSIITNYKNTGKRCTIQAALENIDSCYTISEMQRPEIDHAVAIWPTGQFVGIIDLVPIDIDCGLSHLSKSNTLEWLSTSRNRDVTGVVHLPYIDTQFCRYDCFEVIYIYRGQARKLLARGEERRLREGDLSIIAPNLEHDILVDDENSLVISLLIRKSTFETVFGKLLVENDPLAWFFRDTLFQNNNSHYLLYNTGEENILIRKLIQDILIESYGTKLYANAYANSLVHQLFYIILREHGTSASYFGRNMHTSAQNNFAIILAYVQANYNTATVSSVAKHFSYSNNYLCRLFQQNMHTTFNKFLQNLRIQKAAEYLSYTEIGVAEISRTVGYESVDYFTRLFKKRNNCTPTEYRKKLKN